MSRIMADFFIPYNLLGREMKEFYCGMSPNSFKNDMYWSQEHNTYGLRITFATEEECSMFCLRFGEYLDDSKSAFGI